MANQSFFVLNEALNICPIGVQGELYIGGNGVAMGYINDEERTNKSFIYHEKLGYLYKTGDYGVLNENGYIVFLGRKDHQVKISGYRVELGEIEKKLLECIEVNQAVVMDYQDDEQSKYLTAYVVLNKDVHANYLKDKLSENLPKYMIPKHIISIEQIPLTANGKVNKKALPKPTIQNTKQNSVKPLNKTQHTIFNIWKEVLEMDSIGVDDNFFEVGGNSISLVKAYRKIDNIYPNIVKIVDIFSNPSIRKIAEFIDEYSDYKRETIKIPTLDLPKEFFASGVKKGASFHYKINEEILKELNGISVSNKMSIHEVLISLYFYLLADTTKNSVIPIQVNKESDSDHLNSFVIDLKDIKNIEELYVKVKNLHNNKNTPVYNMNNITNNNYSKQSNSIIPLYLSGEIMKSDREIFDCSLQVKVYNNNIDIVLDFNSNKLNYDKMKTLFNKYLNLIQFITKKVVK